MSLRIASVTGKEAQTPRAPQPTVVREPAAPPAPAAAGPSINISEERQRRESVYDNVNAKPEAQLPPVSRPAGREDPGRITVPSTGEIISLGRGMSREDYGTMLSDPNANASPVARAQAPDVSLTSTKAPNPTPIPSVTPDAPTVASPMSERRAPEVMGGGGSGRPPEDPIEQERRQRTRPEAANNRRPGPDINRRRRSIIEGLTAGAGFGAGAGIFGLLNNQEEQN